MTAEEFQRLPKEDGWRQELVRGEVVRSPGPGGLHGEIEANVVGILLEFMQRSRVGKLLCGGASYILERGPDTVRGPDISIVRRERLSGDRLPASYLELAPDIAIEILSPSNRPGEMKERMSDLFGAGCTEVWLLDPRRETAAVHVRDGAIRHFARDEVLESSVLPGFRCRVGDFFRSQ